MMQKTTLLKIAIPFIAILLGIIIMKGLIASRPEPKKEARKDPGILVQVIRAEKLSTDITVKGTGTVEAAEEVSIIPQVSGRVVYVAPDLDVGGFFKKGEVLFAIEDIDYRLALDRAMAARAKAEYELATIESQARIARTEWERINKNKDIPPNPLVLYEPQLKSAKADLSSAIAAIEQAKLDLERTKLQSPFNSRVRSEDIDLGQYVRSGTGVVVLAGTDTAEIAVPLSLDDLSWLDMPRPGKWNSGAPASVFLRINGNLYEWKGHIIRSTGEVDPKSRMMQIIVGIDDPYGLENKETDRPALAAGTFVDVRIKGRTLENVFVIPRIAFRDNSTVWVMDTSNKLQIEKVLISRIEREKVIIAEGLDDGDMIVLTNISGAANGMKLRLFINNK
jgi:RND family efflux transporter MFP subunit